MTIQSASIAQVANMSPEEVAAELGTKSPSMVGKDISEEIRQRAFSMLERIKKIGDRDVAARNEMTNEAKSFGLEIRRSISQQSELLNQPMQDIMEKNDNSGSIGMDLLALRRKVEQVNPNKFDFAESTFRRLLGKRAFGGRSFAERTTTLKEPRPASQRRSLVTARCQRISDSLDGTFDIGQRIGVTEPQESFSMFSKRGAWKERHTGLFEQGLGDLGAASAKR